MIGAMPAVAVRHERRRAEKRGGARRPSQLPLQCGRPGEDPTPSPQYDQLRDDVYVCAKVSALYVVVGCLLLGIVVLIVGLVQLSPGAEAAKHRYYLIVSGASLVAVGIGGAFLRCFCLHYMSRGYEEETPRAESAPQKNGVSVVEAGQIQGHANEPKVKEKPKLKTQASRDQGPSDLVKQPSTTSEA